MAHLYKASEWASACNDKWYVNDVTELSGPSSKWWVPMRILNLSIENYLLLLSKKYNAKGFNYCRDTDCLYFYFSSLADARKWKNYINAEARKKNFII